jgi:hypothetical protein
MHASQAGARPEGVPPTRQDDPAAGDRRTPRGRGSRHIRLLGRDERAEGACPLDERALFLWPRLDRRALTRCGCDPYRIAAYVARRTSLPLESIVAMLTSGGL